MSYNTLGIAKYTKVVRDVAGVGKGRVVVYGAGEGEIQNPAGANAGSLAGVTWDSAPDGKEVALYEYAYPEIEAAGPINPGQEVNVADAQGRIKAVSEAAGTRVFLVGVAEGRATAAGQRIKVNCRRFGQEKTV